MVQKKWAFPCIGGGWNATEGKSSRRDSYGVGAELHWTLTVSSAGAAFTLATDARVGAAAHHLRSAVCGDGRCCDRNGDRTVKRRVSGSRIAPFAFRTTPYTGIFVQRVLGAPPT
jgi:hypothetical protein